MLNKWTNRMSMSLLLSFSARDLHKNSYGLRPGSGLFIGIIRRRTTTSWLRSRMTLWSSTILHTASALLSVVLGAVRSQQPLTARGHVNAARRAQAWTFTHIQCEKMLAPLLASGPTDSLLLRRPGSPEKKQTKKSTRYKWDVSFCKFTVYHTALGMVSVLSSCELLTAGTQQ